MKASQREEGIGDSAIKTAPPPIFCPILVQFERVVRVAIQKCTPALALYWTARVPVSTPPPCAAALHGDVSLVQEGDWRMIVRKGKVENGNSG